MIYIQKGVFPTMVYIKERGKVEQEKKREPKKEVGYSLQLFSSS